MPSTLNILLCHVAMSLCAKFQTPPSCRRLKRTALLRFYSRYTYPIRFFDTLLAHQGLLPIYVVVIYATPLDSFLGSDRTFPSYRRITGIGTAICLKVSRALCYDTPLLSVAFLCLGGLLVLSSLGNCICIWRL